MWDDIAAVASSAKPPTHLPTALQPVTASHPCQLMAVNVFKVPISLQANDYMLVAQGYFSMAHSCTHAGSKG